MNIDEKRWIRFRIYIVASFFVLALGILICRAYQLQIKEKDRFEVLARATYVKVKKLPPKRGTIYDRNAKEMAVSVQAWSVYARPHKIKNLFEASAQISKIINKKRRHIYSLLKKRSKFVWIARKIPQEWAVKIKALKLAGIGVLQETRRYYPNKEVGAHVIGFVGFDNHGLEGLEKKYDDILSGPEHSLFEMKDALGRPFYMDMSVDPGQELKDIYLTIDRDIQYKVQETLKYAVLKSRARSGNCIVLDPKTGAVLAMAVYPEFNPNIFYEFKPYQWRNRAVTDCYEPGSTVKAFLLAAALQEKVVTPDTIFDCEQGKFKVAKHVIHDSHKHGKLKVSEIIAVSSNIGAIKIGNRLGYEKFYDYLKRFGFGKKTGVDLIGERSGRIRKAKASRPVDQATMFFGQGMSVTSMQLVTAFAAIANGGKLMRPYVVREVRDQKGRLIRRTVPQVVRRVISPEVAMETAQVLEGVVGEDGTAPAAAIPGFEVAGKTGTSQKVNPRTGRYSKHRYVALFVGFVPVTDPKMVILVMIDEPKGIPYGGIVAAPVFRQAGKWALNFMNVTPQILPPGPFYGKNDLPQEKSKLGSRSFSNEKLPDFRGYTIRKVLREARRLGIEVTLEGSGIAEKQDPAPGVCMKGVSRVKVYFRPPK